MKSISLDDIRANPSIYDEIGEALKEGSLVCFPGSSGYKIAVDLNSLKAVTNMLQAKRRVKNAPSLIFMPDHSWAEKVAAHLSDDAQILMKEFWPGSVTLLVEANEDIHPKIRKQLTKAKGWLGIRVPDDEVALAVARAFGGPILVSSANIAKKHGSHSLAQVKKSFGRTADVIIENGDLKEGPQSTLVDVIGETANIVRVAAISEEEIKSALAR